MQHTDGLRGSGLDLLELARITLGQKRVFLVSSLLVFLFAAILSFMKPQEAVVSRSYQFKVPQPLDAAQVAAKTAQFLRFPPGCRSPSGGGLSKAEDRISVDLEYRITGNGLIDPGIPYWKGEVISSFRRALLVGAFQSDFAQLSNVDVAYFETQLEDRRRELAGLAALRAEKGNLPGIPLTQLSGDFALMRRWVGVDAVMNALEKDLFGLQFQQNRYVRAKEKLRAWDPLLAELERVPSADKARWLAIAAGIPNVEWRRLAQERIEHYTSSIADLLFVSETVKIEAKSIPLWRRLLVSALVAVCFGLLAAFLVGFLPTARADLGVRLPAKSP